jgi:hypothetical protein
MRLELKMQNGPFVWLGFLLFIGLYVAGFDSWLSKDPETALLDNTSLRLGLAGVTFGFLSYVMVLLEPKERVFFRRLGGQILSGRVVSAFLNLQAWMMSYKATVLVGLILILRVVESEGRFGQDAATIAALLGFLTRDVAIFVLFQSLPGRRRGDFAAVVALFALHGLIPVILGRLDLGDVMVLFRPTPVDPVWLAPVVAWGEGLIVAGLAIARISANGRVSVEPARA